ncbi:hypothetical protein, partial [Corynebacterium lehmanniae]
MDAQSLYRVDRRTNLSEEDYVDAVDALDLDPDTWSQRYMEDQNSDTDFPTWAAIIYERIR